MVHVVLDLCVYLPQVYKDYLLEWRDPVSGESSDDELGSPAKRRHPGSGPWLVFDCGMVHWPNFQAFLEKLAKMERRTIDQMLAEGKILFGNTKKLQEGAAGGARDGRNDVHVVPYRPILRYVIRSYVLSGRGP